SLRVAGGLSTQPHLAVPLNAFIREHQVIPVVRAITNLFRESDVLRHSREKPGSNSSSSSMAGPRTPFSPPCNLVSISHSILPSRQPLPRKSTAIISA